MGSLKILTRDESSKSKSSMMDSVKEWMGKLYKVTLKYQPLLRRVPISFNPTSYYTCTGQRRTDDYSSDTTEFHKLQERYWEPLIRDRNLDQEAKEKFRQGGKEMYETYKKDFPNITEQELMDLKLQFQTFDLNMDGLIDYNELGQVLDDLGDKSSQTRRKQYFDDMDADGSGAIDFEEFLHLIDSISASKYDVDNPQDQDKKDIGLLCNVGKQNLHTLRQLSLDEKLNNNLF